jgi:hypothetical protein
LKLYVNGVVRRGFILGAPNQARLRLSLYRKGVNIVGTIYRLDRFEVLARANLYSAVALAGDVWIEQTGAAFRIERVAGNDASYSAPTLAAPAPLTLVTANPRSVTLRCGGHPEGEKYIWEQLVAAVWVPVSETVVPVTTIQNLQSSTAYDFRVSVATREREVEPIYDTAIPWNPDENWDSELVKPDTLSMVLWNRNRRWNDGAVWG